MNRYQKALSRTSLKEFFQLANHHKSPDFTQTQLSHLIWLQEVIWQAIIDNKIRYSRKLAKTQLIFDVRKLWNWRKQTGKKYTIKPVWPFFKNNIVIEGY